MEAIASSSSSNVTRANSDLSDGQRPKLRPEQSFQLEGLSRDIDSEALSISPSGRWHRMDSALASKHPRFYAMASRFVFYVRGPRPKRDLAGKCTTQVYSRMAHTYACAGPSPALDSSFTVKGKIYNLSVEHTLLRFTRPLASPWLFILLGVAYIIGLAFFSRAQSFLTPASSFVGCTSTYWLEDDGCGIDGSECAPFTNSSFDFRCPAQCNSVILENPRTIGDITVDFVPLLVGGGDVNKTYRGDSFICAAAVQA